MRITKQVPRLDVVVGDSRGGDSRDTDSRDSGGEEESGGREPVTRVKVRVTRIRGNIPNDLKQEKYFILIFSEVRYGEVRS